MKIELKPEHERFVRQKVESGLFADESEVVSEALDAMRQDDEFTPEQEAHYRLEVAKGLGSIEAGRARPLDIEQLIREERQKKGL